MLAISGQEHGEYCVAALTYEFRYYNRLYPDFVTVGNRTWRWRQWRYHLVHNSSQMINEPSRLTAFCAALVPTDQLMDLELLDYESDLVFCGQYSRNPESFVEKRAVALIDELLDFARFGSPDALHSFVLPLPYKRHIQLNADVEYFMRKILQISGERNFDWSTGHLESQMSAERKGFVDEALAHGDFQSVLDTTGPCNKE